MRLIQPPPHLCHQTGLLSVSFGLRCVLPLPFYDELLRFFIRSLRDPHEAQDLAQETFGRVQVKLAAGEPVDDMRGLLYEVARNLLIDRYRQLRVRNHVSDDVLAEMPGPVSSDPEVLYAGQQRMRLLVQTIDNLPPRCREAFVLHRFDGLSQAQVAAQMGISVNMVERHVMLALAACRQALGEVRVRRKPMPEAASEPSRS